MISHHLRRSVDQLYWLLATEGAGRFHASVLMLAEVYNGTEQSVSSLFSVFYVETCYEISKNITEIKIRNRWKFFKLDFIWQEIGVFLEFHSNFNHVNTVIHATRTRRTSHMHSHTHKPTHPYTQAHKHAPQHIIMQRRTCMHHTHINTQSHTHRHTIAHSHTDTYTHTHKHRTREHI